MIWPLTNICTVFSDVATFPISCVPLRTAFALFPARPAFVRHTSKKSPSVALVPVKFTVPAAVVKLLAVSPLAFTPIVVGTATSTPSTKIDSVYRSASTRVNSSWPVATAPEKSS